MKVKNKLKRPPANWPHHSLHKAAARTLEASDLVALSSDQLAFESARRGASRRGRVTTARTRQALAATQSMLEEAASAIQRARHVFAPLSATRSPF